MNDGAVVVTVNDDIGVVAVSQGENVVLLGTVADTERLIFELADALTLQRAGVAAQPAGA